jgi:CRP/FNR family transcriptional regulator
MAVGNKIIDVATIKVACGECSLSRLCLPMGLDGEDMDRLDALMKRPRPLRRGEHLFRSGDLFHSIYAVRSGSVKTYTPCQDGSEQVIGFHLPGELVGLDAIDGERHICSGRVLETTTVCALPFDRVQEVARDLPSLQRHFLRLMSKELAHDEAMLMLLGKASAEERLATFLVSLAQRFRVRGFSGNEFNLSMSRHDIGNYLGLAVETVSRMFSKLQEDGVLSVHRKNIRIHDPQRLRAMTRLDENHSVARCG